jgi:hypothetical protein
LLWPTVGIYEVLRGRFVPKKVRGTGSGETEFGRKRLNAPKSYDFGYYKDGRINRLTVGLRRRAVPATQVSDRTRQRSDALARYLARNKVARQLEGYPKFQAVDRAIDEGGWKIVALLRLLPAIPFIRAHPCDPSLRPAWISRSRVREQDDEL